MTRSDTCPRSTGRRAVGARGCSVGCSRRGEGDSGQRGRDRGYVTAINGTSDDVALDADTADVGCVEIAETTTQAAVPDEIIAESERCVLADAEACGVLSTSLWWVVELELVVGGDVARAVLAVGQDTALERDEQLGISLW